MRKLLLSVMIIAVGIFATGAALSNKPATHVAGTMSVGEFGNIHVAETMPVGGNSAGNAIETFSA